MWRWCRDVCGEKSKVATIDKGLSLKMRVLDLWSSFSRRLGLGEFLTHRSHLSTNIPPIRNCSCQYINKSAA